MTASYRIITAGDALYGPSWVNPLADGLGVDRRTINRWARGTSTPKPGVWVDLAALCRARAAALVKMADSLIDVADSL